MNMSRRAFVASAMSSGAALGVRQAAAAGIVREPVVADGIYEVGSLAGEPMLAAASENSVAVSWAVSADATGEVLVADNPGMKDARRVRAGEMPLAAMDDVSLMVRIDGLRPATRYWYRAVTREIVSQHNPYAARITEGRRQESAVHSFTTPGASAESRFGVINDTHAQWDSFAFTAAAVKSMRFPVVVWNGDALNCTEDKRTAAEAFLLPDVPTKDYASDVPMLFLPGNHEMDGRYASHIDEVVPCRPWAEREGKYAALKWNFAVRQGDIALVGCDTAGGLHDDDTRACGLFSCSPYRQLQAEWLEDALSRPEIASAPFAVLFCHIPLFNSGPNPNGCEKPLPRGCASWIRECADSWGPILDRHGVQLVVAGHEHANRWDEDIPGRRWKQVLGGGPELGYGAGFRPNDKACPTIIEGVAKDGKMVVTVHDIWRKKTISSRTFQPRKLPA